MSHMTADPIVAIVIIAFLTFVYLLTKIEWMEIEWARVFTTIALIPMLIAVLPLYLALWSVYAMLMLAFKQEVQAPWNMSDPIPTRKENKCQRKRRRA